MKTDELVALLVASATSLNPNTGARRLGVALAWSGSQARVHFDRLQRSRSMWKRAATSGPWLTCCTRTLAATAARKPRSC